MDNIPMAQYRDAYRGRECCVVGCGPLPSNLAELPSEIVFLIGHAVFLPGLAAANGKPLERFFHVVDPELPFFCEIEGVTYIGVYHTYRTGPRQIDSQIVYLDFDRPMPPWCHNKDYISLTGNLGLKYGSVTSLLHFVWFCGFDKVYGVGINPATANEPYDPRVVEVVRKHVPDFAGTKPPEIQASMDLILAHQQQYVDELGLNVEYL